MGARRFEPLKNLADELRELGAASVGFSDLDVTQNESVENFHHQLTAKHPVVDVLFNNAGMALGTEPVAQGELGEWEQVINTNLTGLLRITRKILPGMIEHRSGQIINMGSVAAFNVYEGGAIYCATKHAVRAITQTLRLEVNGTGIRVCSIDPGMVETDFSKVRFRGDEQRASKVYQGMTPLTGDDIAECVDFVINRPAHVNIDQITLMPTDQASVSKVARKT